MRVNLRKAAHIQSAIRADLNDSKPNYRIEASLTTKLPEDLDRNRREIIEQIERTDRLEDILYRIRAAVGEANGKVGIAALLSEREMLDIRRKRLAGLIKAQQVQRLVADDKIEAELALIRQRLDKSEYYGAGNDSVIVSTFSEQKIDEFKRKLVEVSRRLNDISDELIRINLNETIEIAETDYTYLTESGIV